MYVLNVCVLFETNEIDKERPKERNRNNRGEREKDADALVDRGSGRSPEISE